MIAGIAVVAPAKSLNADQQFVRTELKNSSYFANAEDYLGELIKTDQKFTTRVLFDYATNNWRDVLLQQI